MSFFHCGDIVLLRDDLVVDKVYGRENDRFCASDATYIGRRVKVTIDANNRYRLSDVESRRELGSVFCTEMLCWNRAEFLPGDMSKTNKNEEEESCGVQRVPEEEEQLPF